MVVMYGIKNCDTIKKARRWLENNHVDYQFHDYRADGLDAQLMHKFIAELGWEALLNTRGHHLAQARRGATRDDYRRRQRGRADAGNAGNHQTTIALRAG